MSKVANITIFIRLNEILILLVVIYIHQVFSSFHLISGLNIGNTVIIDKNNSRLYLDRTLFVK